MIMKSTKKKHLGRDLQKNKRMKWKSFVQRTLQSVDAAATTQREDSD
jgi:hypothetical protein